MKNQELESAKVCLINALSSTLDEIDPEDLAKILYAGLQEECDYHRTRAEAIERLLKELQNPGRVF